MMMAFFMLISCFLLNSVKVSSGFLQLQYDSHPFIYFTGDDIPNIQKMAKSTHLHLAQDIKEAVQVMMEDKKFYLPPKEYTAFGSRWNEIYGNNLAPLALHCVLEPDDIDAFDFVMEYMDIMASLSKWQVIAIPLDEVPVAHSLTGFITAFDFLYLRLSDSRKTKYLQRIMNETKAFAEYTRKRSWGRFYLQNHVASNFVALFHGCLVTVMHMKSTLPWLQFTVMMLERNFKLLNHIVDGSLDEGVAYGSYTSRSFTQYAFLALRHFGIDHTEDNWLQEHFLFFYHTVLPKFQRTVGIADSNDNWFYGPESQLMFLETYVMRNGHGNWLAQKIKENRVNDQKNPLSPARGQRWCTLHTEFLWYDPTIAPVAPSADLPELKTFSDWGVATYRTSPHEPNGTFLAFKSGALHGRAIFDIIKRGMYPWLKGWSNFNPGHEHPDQNMFIVTMNGEQIITDALYGPKLSYLNNVLAFSPSPTSRCNSPWEGQLGECGKWLDWKDPKMKNYRGDIVFADEREGHVFISGEAVNAYDKSMGLLSVFRSLILLQDDLLVIVDHIETKSQSSIKYVSAFFHNLEHEFLHDKLHERVRGVKLRIKEKLYKMFWVTSLEKSPEASIVKEIHPSEFQKRKTNFINVTIKLTPTITRVAYVLAGPNVSLQEVQFMDNDIEGCYLNIKSSQEYNINIATRHDNLNSRQNYLNFPGFASVETELHKVFFGVPLDSISKYETKTETDFAFVLPVLIAMILFSCFCLFLRPQCGKKITFRLRTKCKIVSLICVILLLPLVLYVLRCQDKKCNNFQPRPKVRSITTPQSGKLESIVPYITIASLPGSGAEAVGWLFYNNPDIFTLPLPYTNLKIPFPKLESIDNSFTDFCSWEGNPEEDLLHLKTWLNELSAKTQHVGQLSSEDDMFQDIFFGASLQPTIEKHLAYGLQQNIIYKNYTIKMLTDHMETHPSAIPALFFTTGSWALKASWLFQNIGEKLRHIHIVRDPRSWIANLLRSNMKLSKELMVGKVLRHFIKSPIGGCAPSGTVIPEFKAIHNLLKEMMDKDYHKLLAWVWRVHAEASLRQATNLTNRNFHFVKVEDFLEVADEVAKDVYNFIGLPLRPVNVHQALQVTRSSVYMIPYEGVFGKGSLNVWKQVLSNQQVADITEICSPLMAHFGYS